MMLSSPSYAVVAQQCEEGKMEQRESIQTYLQAIELCDAALSFAVHDFKILKRKAMAYEKLSEMYLEQQQHEDAIENLKQALAAYKSAFSQTLNDADAISYVGMLTERLGELQSVQKQYAQAFDSYQQAISIYNTALKLAPDDSCNHALKAGGLTSLADLQTRLCQHKQAVSNYQHSVACYDSSLSLNSFKAVEFDKARTLQKLGTCFEKLSLHSEALSCYQAAMEVLRQLPPDNKYVRCLREQIQKLNCLE